MPSSKPTTTTHDPKAYRRRPTVFRLPGVRHTLSVHRDYARIIARSYEIESEYEQAAINDWKHVWTREGIENLKVSLWENAQGEAVLDFHGSDHLEDWFKHVHMFARSFAWPPENDQSAHEGEGSPVKIHESWMQTLITDVDSLSLENMLTMMIRECSEYRLVHVIGHSYGGALAILFMFTKGIITKSGNQEIGRDEDQVTIGELVTFGSPNPVSAAPDRLPGIHYRLSLDPVSWMPPWYRGRLSYHWIMSWPGRFFFKHLIRHFLKWFDRKLHD